MRLLLIVPLLALVLVLVGCDQSKTDSLTDSAIRACGGEGKVAYVNVDEGRFGCKGGAFSRDH